MEAAYQALLAEARPLGLVRADAKAPPTTVCLVPSDRAYCAQPQPVVGCATDGGVVLVAMYYPFYDWRWTLVDELAKRLWLRRVLLFEAWHEAGLLADRRYLPLVTAAWQRLTGRDDPTKGGAK